MVRLVLVDLEVTRDEVLCPLVECVAEVCAGLAVARAVFDEVECVAV